MLSITPFNWDFTGGLQVAESRPKSPTCKTNVLLLVWFFDLQGRLLYLHYAGVAHKILRIQALHLVDSFGKAEIL